MVRQNNWTWLKLNVFKIKLLTPSYKNRVNNQPYLFSSNYVKLIFVFLLQTQLHVGSHLRQKDAFETVILQNCCIDMKVIIYKLFSGSGIFEILRHHRRLFLHMHTVCMHDVGSTRDLLYHVFNIILLTRLWY